MSRIASLGAIVLCGGRSSRMSRDKASLAIGEETFLQRICRLASDVATEIVVVASANQQLCALPDEVTVCRDAVPGEGPLAALLTGFQTLRQSSPAAEFVWIGSCDAPFVNTVVIRQMLQILSDNEAGDAIVLVDNEGLKPFGAICRQACESAALSLVESGERRLQALFERVSVSRVDVEKFRPLDPELLFLHNINTPADYKRLVGQGIRPNEV